jgi:hypothetical protein
LPFRFLNVLRVVLFVVVEVVELPVVVVAFGFMAMDALCPGETPRFLIRSVRASSTST